MREPGLPWIDWKKWRPLLGRLTDCELARRIGCSRSAVIRERQKYGIRPAPSKTARLRWTPGRISKLGTDSDARIARKLGVTERTVARERRKRGIPPFYPERDHRRGPRALQGAKAPPSIVSAVQRARLAGLTDDQIRYVFGDLLEARR